MLRQRVATAVALAGVFVLADFLPPPWFAGVVGVFVLAGAYEWAHLSGVTSRAHEVIWLVAVALSGGVLYLRPGNSFWIIATAAAWWLVMTLWLLTRTRLGAPWPVPVRLAAGLVVLIPAWWALVTLQADDPVLVLWVAGVVWIADTAAFFSGRRWGRTKLAPLLSPGKTREGLYGALVAAATFSAVIGGLFWSASPGLLTLWVGLSLAAALFSVAGDLFESFMKRVAGVKDSGNLLPGHGGVLDRVDSISAAAPVFACGWLGLVKPLASPAGNAYAEMLSFG